MINMKTNRFLLATSFILALVSVAFSQKTLDLQAFSAKDTASFETYAKRLAVVQDSINATHKAIENVKNNSASSMPKFKPKDEFEKQPEFEARKIKWDKDLADKINNDTKPLAARLAELEGAKKKIEENQISLYGSLNIKSSPEAASIWIGREEVGTTPAEYNYLIPGTVRISVRKEGYNPWDTTLLATPGAKLRFNVTLDEKSIFSQENEIDFAGVLSKDTTIGGYLSRMEIIRARKAQSDAEIRAIMENFENNYPALDAQKPGESADAFSKRHDAWYKEGMRHVMEFHKKHEAYKQKLDRSLAVLNDYIVSAQSTILSEVAFAAKVELGTYDPDKELFELVAQDSASGKSPFYFKGKIGIPRDTAKVMNRAAPGLAVNLQFINYPFNDVNLAMSSLQLSKNGVNFKVDGSFSEIGRYKSEGGYAEWKLRADSLLSGTLKAQGLDYAFAMGRAATKEVVATSSAKDESGSGLGWRGWTRIITYTLAAASGGASIYKHFEMEDGKDKYGANADLVKERKNHRNIYTITAGTLALVGTITFLF
ncbi:MAG: PEGA domain-containing protein [Fibromonadales bacterium]|nr:PEGA domain-containing protein [Fibromonadales bacterium]